MAITTPEHAYHIMRTQNLVFWTLRAQPQAGVISRYQRHDGNVEDSINELRETLDRVQGDYVYLSLRDKSKEAIAAGDKAVGHYPNIKIRLPHQIGAMPQFANVAHSTTGSPSWRDLLDEVEKRKEAELELIRAKISQPAEPEPPSLGERLLERIVEHPSFDSIVTGIAAALLPKAPPAAPAPTVTGQEAQDKLTSALNRISTVDPNYVHTLDKLADHLQKHPEVLTMVKNVIGA